MNPCIKKDETVSPGCCLARMNATFFWVFSPSLLVTVSKCTPFPAILVQRTSFLIYLNAYW